MTSDDCHPLSRELCLKAVAEYYLVVRNETFLVFAVDLLFDARTQDNLRCTLVEFVVRLSANAAAQGVLTRLITDHTETLLRTLQQESRKRKRNMRQSFRSQSLTALLPVFALSTHDGNTTGPPNTTLSLLTSQLVGDDQIKEQIQIFCDAAQRKRTLSVRLESSALTILQSIDQYCKGPDKKLSQHAVKTVTQFLSVCCDETAPSILCVRGLELIAAIAHAFHVNMSRSDCEQILGILHKLLRSDVWPFRACALSTFAVFATRVPSTYKDSLRSCLPESMRKRFQCRMKRMAVDSDGKLAQLNLEHHKAISGTVNTKQRSLFSSYSTMFLEEGSYVMTMPTMENREAIVIFPPRPESLEDIEYMLNDDSTRVVQTLRRVILTNGGCKLALCETHRSSR